MSSIEPNLLMKSGAFKMAKINAVVCQVMSLRSLAACHQHLRKTQCFHLQEAVCW